MFNNDINLNLFKVFYDVARYGSFSKAAELTYSTQPAISKSIKKLEDELVTKLFIRKQNGVELTDKGKELLFYVEKSFGNLLTGQRVMLENDNLDRGSISIGIPSNLYSYYLVDKVIDFNNKYPKIEISIISGPTSYLLKKLENHKIDFIIDTLPIEVSNNDLSIIKLFDMHYCFASKEQININSLKELENEKVILPIKDTNNRLLLDELLLRNDIKLNKVINIHTTEMILESIKNNIGIGYILEEYIKEDIKNKLLYKLNIDNLPITEVAIIYNKKFLTNAPKNFINEYIIKI